ncbi:MAG TPA: translation elongation factor Ts [Williamwhitmania sp.]|jgi:elongation factor Ts|nr:translation elongation factor Ts [Williamwhitmania sp.]
MAQISAADVAKLRKMTGAGMMDCKKALEEANGDYERAQEIIREKGKLIASKRADREATEGVVFSKVSADNKKGVVICLACETDFVAKNADFIALANQILDIALTNTPADLNSLLALNAGGKTIGDLVTEKSGITGEKFTLAYYQKLEAAFCVPYIHMNNKLATLVAFSKVVPIEVGKDIAMQVAAMNPVAIDKDSCPAEVIEKELHIAREQVRLEGKPENLVEKIAQGKLGKFFKDSTLLSQDFIKDSKMTVDAYLKGVDPAVKVAGFKRFTLND